MLRNIRDGPRQVLAAGIAACVGTAANTAAAHVGEGAMTVEAMTRAIVTAARSAC
jgi:hypothetical protein